MTWNPERYLAFGDHRTRPAVDLLARIPFEAPERVTDLGCGPGNSTALLVERWPEAEVLGVDTSAEMLAKVRASSIRASWTLADITDWVPDALCDVIFSNAALQWLPDHGSLLPRLFNRVGPGGVLAVQMPRNFGSPSYVLLRAVAAAGRWAARVEPVLLREPAGTPAWYYDLLAPLAAGLDIWESEYLHVLEGDDPVLNWMRSTALRPVQAALEAGELRAFEAEYKERLRSAYPKRADGCTLFPFRRLFIVAVRSEAGWRLAGSRATGERSACRSG
jgi:trans-aconitate 2-methyltransferase